MLFMVIERFRDSAAVYARFVEKGRLLPEGVIYLDSWVAEDGSRCYQLMECAGGEDLEPWLAAWGDLIDFEVVPVVDSATAAQSFER
jgi:hypothetical protein